MKSGDMEKITECRHATVGLFFRDGGSEPGTEHVAMGEKQELGAVRLAHLLIPCVTAESVPSSNILVQGSSVQHALELLAPRLYVYLYIYIIF